MKNTVIREYADGANTYHEFSLPDHPTKTGDEDHFSLAMHDARMILLGMKRASPNSIFTIQRVEV